jgi:imidazolonepropionase-like amidohydrolase
MRRLAAAAIGIVFALRAGAAAVVLSGGTVIDGYGNPPIANGVVVIDGDRILAVGGRDSVAVPEGAEIISTEGMTVLPGLWDMQVERQLLEAGVTSARDGASPLEAAITVRSRIRERQIPGPTLYVSGPVLRKQVTPGAETWQWAVNGAADVTAKVKHLDDSGVDYLLLGEVDSWTPEELAALIAEARLRGLPVHAYAERFADVERGTELQFDGFLGTGAATANFPESVTLALQQRLASTTARPLAWTPAISAVLNLESLRANPEPLDDPRAIEALPPLVAADILGSLRDLDGVDFEMPAAKAQTACARLRQLQDARVTLLVGSDAGAAGHLHTRATWQEIDFWVRECGIPALRAIQAATHDAATAQGVGHESGSLAPGKIADVIAVRGDVLRTPALLQSVDIIIQRGRRVR